MKIGFYEIVYVEGCRSYVKLVTETKSHLILFSMKGVEKFLPTDLFKRIHRSFIVSLDKIKGFDTGNVYIKDKELPVGQLYKGVLEKSVLIVNDSIPGINIHDSSLNPIPFVYNSHSRIRMIEADKFF